MGLCSKWGGVEVDMTRAVRVARWCGVGRLPCASPAGKGQRWQTQHYPEVLNLPPSCCYCAIKEE